MGDFSKSTVTSLFAVGYFLGEGNIIHLYINIMAFTPAEVKLEDFFEFKKNNNNVISML